MVKTKKVRMVKTKKDKIPSFSLALTSLIDYFFKFDDDKSEAVMVRTNIDARVGDIARGVGEYVKKEQGIEFHLEALKVTLAGEEVKDDFLWQKVPGSLFILHVKELSEKASQHKGKLWQCIPCDRDSRRRADVKHKGKCKGQYLFEHKRKKLGHEAARSKMQRPQYCPMGHFCEDEPIPIQAQPPEHHSNHQVEAEVELLVMLIVLTIPLR